LVSKIQMEAKKFLVSLCLIASVLFLMSTIAAAEITDDYTVYVRNSAIGIGDIIGVTEGETISIRVVFNSLVDANEVKIEAEIDGQKADVEDTTAEFDVEIGKRYSKTLSLRIPHDLKDEVSDDATLEIEISNQDDETKLADIDLRIQRETYNPAIMSISTTQTADAGQLFPVDVVLKNKGYNNLDDLYVTVSIPELGIERTAYFGDLVALEDDEDDDDETDTVSGRIYLKISDDAKSGTYTLEVEASNEDTTTTKVKEIVVDALEETVIKSSDGLIVVNPTNKVKVYRIVSDTSENFVVISAGSSKTIEITSDGEYNVFSGDELIKTVNVEGKKSQAGPSAAAVLTVVLAIIFIVLLIVLFVLVGKKPETSEEFGESYY